MSLSSPFVKGLTQLAYEKVLHDKNLEVFLCIVLLMIHLLKRKFIILYKSKSEDKKLKIWRWMDEAFFSLRTGFRLRPQRFSFCFCNLNFMQKYGKQSWDGNKVAMFDFKDSAWLVDRRCFFCVTQKAHRSGMERFWRTLKQTFKAIILRLTIWLSMQIANLVCRLKTARFE